MTHQFDPARLTQARALSGLSAAGLAASVGVEPAVVEQCELGAHRPSADLLARLADALAVPLAHFAPGRPHGRPDQDSPAAALAGLAWELAHALHRRVALPAVDLPAVDLPAATVPGADPDPGAAARELRRRWGLGDGPVTHLVRRLEAHGIVAVRPERPLPGFATARLTRPVVVLAAADDVHRHRFRAACLLGRLVLPDERDAAAFAVEFLTPGAAIGPELPERADVGRLAALRDHWGVPAASLLRRCRELGRMTPAVAERAAGRLADLDAPSPVADYPGERPALLREAFARSGLTTAVLADELAWPPSRLRELLGERRPALSLVR